jgi:hypothetical protein
MSLTYDDLAVCGACGTVRPRDALELLDTADAGPVWACRDVAACHAAMTPGAVTGSAAPGTATGTRGESPRLCGAGSRPRRDWAGLVTVLAVLVLAAAAGLALYLAATLEVGQ